MGYGSHIRPKKACHSCSDLSGNESVRIVISRFRDRATLKQEFLNLLLLARVGDLHHFSGFQFLGGSRKLHVGADNRYAWINCALGSLPVGSSLSSVLVTLPL